MSVCVCACVIEVRVGASMVETLLTHSSSNGCAC